MSARGASTRRRLRRAAVVPGLAALAVVLAATPGAAQTRPNLPFARGQLVSRSGATLDIKGFNGESKVIVNGSTKYQQTRTADASAVKVGDCVRVTGTGSASKGIAATNVALSPAASNCNQANGGAGFGGRFRNRNGAGNANGNPNGNPNRNTNGNRPDFRTTNFGSVTGKITKVAGDKVTVKGTVLQPAAKANTRPRTAKKTVSVTLANDTRFEQTVSATADAVTVGTCVTAAGSADSVGTVTARTVTVSDPVNGACTGGFGGGFGGGPGGFPGGPGGPNGTGSTGTGSTGTGSTGTGTA